jgi:hypothetical protein
MSRPARKPEVRTPPARRRLDGGRRRPFTEGSTQWRQTPDSRFTSPEIPIPASLSISLTHLALVPVRFEGCAAGTVR